MYDFEGIARFLIEEKLFLSALELYTELLLRGNELTNLTEYFNNSGNFEDEPTLDGNTLTRSSSDQTLESLDMTRGSEDGEHCLIEKVAVLEFELRKARDAIRSLRNNLTVVTEKKTDDAETSSASKPMTNEECGGGADNPLLPHEQQSLNFLVNEYLLQHNYKLTAITFSEEEENQNVDFDDWDAVGLNISKPPKLGQLYRHFYHGSNPKKKTSSE